MQVHLSKSQIGLLVAGVIISGLTAFSAASKSGLMTLDSRGLLAEVIGSGYQKAGQVTFWKDGGTLTGDPNFMWDNVRKWLTVRGLDTRGIISRGKLELYPGFGAPPSDIQTVEVRGRVIIGSTINPAAIEAFGGLRLRDTGRRPGCAEDYRGLFWFSQSSIADSVWVCVNDNNGAYLWRQLLLNKGESGGL